MYRDISPLNVFVLGLNGVIPFSSLRGRSNRQQLPLIGHDDECDLGLFWGSTTILPLVHLRSEGACGMKALEAQAPSIRPPGFQGLLKEAFVHCLAT